MAGSPRHPVTTDAGLALTRDPFKYRRSAKIKTPHRVEPPLGRLLRSGGPPRIARTFWCELWLHTTCCPASAGHRHPRQGLSPAVPAPPVGPSPGFPACVCVVTSPNEINLDLEMSLGPPHTQKRSKSLNTRGAMFCQEKTSLIAQEFCDCTVKPVSGATGRRFAGV